MKLRASSLAVPTFTVDICPQHAAALSSFAVLAFAMLLIISNSTCEMDSVTRQGCSFVNSLFSVFVLNCALPTFSLSDQPQRKATFVSFPPLESLLSRVPVEGNKALSTSLE